MLAQETGKKRTDWLHWNSIEAHNSYWLKRTWFIHNQIGILACTFPIGRKNKTIQISHDADEAGGSTVTQEEHLVHVSDQRGNQHVATPQEEWAGIYKP